MGVELRLPARQVGAFTTALHVCKKKYSGYPMEWNWDWLHIR